MPSSIGRRTLLKQGTVLGASAILTSNSMGLMERIAFAATAADMAAVTGADYFRSTTAAVDALGGIGLFVPKQSTVGQTYITSTDLRRSWPMSTNSGTEN